MTILKWFAGGIVSGAVIALFATGVGALSGFAVLGYRMVAG